VCIPLTLHAHYGVNFGSLGVSPAVENVRGVCPVFQMWRKGTALAALMNIFRSDGLLEGPSFKAWSTLQIEQVRAHTYVC